ncbi:hypothetical protein BDW71DRAFT_211606 [Aspergillus fruticulosus]
MTVAGSVLLLMGIVVETMHSTNASSNRRNDAGSHPQLLRRAYRANRDAPAGHNHRLRPRPRYGQRHPARKRATADHPRTLLSRASVFHELHKSSRGWEEYERQERAEDDAQNRERAEKERADEELSGRRGLISEKERETDAQPGHTAPPQATSSSAGSPDQLLLPLADRRKYCNLTSKLTAVRAPKTSNKRPTLDAPANSLVVILLSTASKPGPLPPSLSLASSKIAIHVTTGRIILINGEVTSFVFRGRIHPDHKEIHAIDSAGLRPPPPLPAAQLLGALFQPTLNSPILPGRARTGDRVACNVTAFIPLAK